MKKTMKIASLILALVFACMTFGAFAEDTSLSSIQADGVMVVATSPDFPPFESLEGEEIVGIEVDIMAIIAQKLGVEIQYEPIDFDSVLPGVVAGRFDVGMSGITVTEKRLLNVDFTQPYFLASQAIVVLTGSEITCKADLDGKKVSVQTGTTAESYCGENGYNVLSYQANNDAAQALLSGKVDAWVVDNEVAIAIAADHPEEMIVLDEAMTSEPYAFAFKKGSAALVQAIDEILAELIADGTIQTIFDNYGVYYVSPVAEEAAEEPAAEEAAADETAAD